MVSSSGSETFDHFYTENYIIPMVNYFTIKRSIYYLWGFEGVFRTEVNVEEEDAALVNGAGRAEDR